MSLYGSLRVQLRAYARHTWLVLVPAVVAFVVGAVYAMAAPDEYGASSILVVRLAKPVDRLLRSAVDSSQHDILRSVQTRMLSHEALVTVTEEHDLYSEIRETNGMEAALRLVRKNVRVAANGRSGTVKVTYATSDGADPSATCANVVNDLVKYFLDHHNSELTTQGTGIKLFLEESGQAVRKELQLVEEALHRFEKKHAGRLPTDQDANTDIIRMSEQRIEAAKQAQERNRLTMEALQIDLFRARESLRLNREEFQSDAEISQMKAIARGLRAEIVKAETLYNEKSDVVKNLNDQLERTEAKVEELLQSMRDGTHTGSHVGEMYEALIGMHDRNIKTLSRRNELYEKTITSANAAIESAQQSIIISKKIATEYASLVHNVESAKARRTVLEEKLQDADIQVRFGQRKEGGIPIEIAERAIPNNIPIGPKRLETSMMGLVAGLAVGVSLAFLKIRFDRSVRSPDDLRLLLPGAVVVTLPEVMGGGERTYRWVGNVLLATILLGLTSLAVAGLGIRMGWWGDVSLLHELRRMLPL